MARSHIYVRPLNPHDEVEIAAWVRAVADSDKTFPRGVFTLPTTHVMVAEKREEHGHEIVAYQPHYASLVLGSFLAVAGASDTELASAQHMLTAAAYTRAHREGFADILALTNTWQTAAFAKRHGYEPAHPAWRMEVR